nr:starch phosphorylase [uncultured Gammaproteobacteria bacterium]BAL55754.1 starch phosphorylase [uncultured Gammaproteobacteria bacterium]
MAEVGFIAKEIRTIKQALINHLIYSLGKDPVEAKERDWFLALAYSVRDLLTLRWMETRRRYYVRSAKRVYYLSMEYLLGRSLLNNLIHLGRYEEFRQALEEMGQDLNRLAEIEDEAALGNGGLGRLAACFLDSLATLGLPGFGYGIRYEYGIFRQAIENGWQVEHPDHWLRYAHPWEIVRPEIRYLVQFGGRTETYYDGAGKRRHRWLASEDVLALAYDVPIPGYGGQTVNNLRLWAAKASREFDLRYFNEGNYIQAVAEKIQSENLSKVLYPDDTTQMGRELRFRQEYFFASASVQDILATYLQDHTDLEEFPNRVAIQLNDTHPALAIAELMRLLLDQHGLDWGAAWEITHRTFAYTNHTLLPEALETWPVSLFERLLPRHLEILYEINARFLHEVHQRYPGDVERVRRLSLIEEGEEKRVRMAHLAVVGSHKVNGVSKLHSRLMQETIFQDFAGLYPDRFLNVTNGVTQRRWLHQANPPLAELITVRLGPGWITDAEQLKQIARFADDATFREAFGAAKRAAKTRLAERLHAELGQAIDPDTLFDVQIKRIHEYKRQVLNVLHVITRYNRLRAGLDLLPRTVILGGKAAPGYFMAKLIIKLICDVAEVINRDPAVGDRLKLIFVPNYGVTCAMALIPATELSEQISMAGTEASGTSNLKMALNGALTIGTLDGANIELREAVGEENFFHFGHTAEEIQALRRRGYNPRDYYQRNPELKQAIDMIAGGFFSPDDPSRFRPLVDALLGGDRFAVLADYEDYIACQERIDRLYLDPAAWTAKAILNLAYAGRFSSDRAIREYAEKIWNLAPISAV